MRHMAQKARWLSTVLAALVLASCTSLRVVRLDDVGVSLKAGDWVKITTKDGQVRELRVESVTESAIVGKDERVEFTDIAQLEKREADTAKTAALTGGTVGVALGIVLAIAAFVTIAPAMILASAGP